MSARDAARSPIARGRRICVGEGEGSQTLRRPLERTRRGCGILGAVSTERRNNVHVSGAGPATMFFAHGFGCDQNMWRLLAPAYEKRYRTVLFDLVGSGSSDLSAYDPVKYGSLQGYADDVVEIAREFGEGPGIFVGHSVSAMIGLLADLSDPGRFAAHIMIGPSPSYINDGDYVGGFSQKDIESLLETLESNYLGWSSNMAPAIMGAPEQPELAVELTNSFCRTDPEIAKQFARVTFLSDVRPALPRLTTPTLIVQCDDDLIAPVAVGEYLHRVLPHSTLSVIANVGHCPHLSAPSASTAAIDAFLEKEGL
jgi:sigma-B regulation protein RsbQ